MYFHIMETYNSMGGYVGSYMDINKDFTETYLEKDREYADNNTACKDFKEGVAGFFVDCATSVYILRQIEDIITQDNTKFAHLKVYQPIRDISDVATFCPNSIYSTCLKDLAGNPIVASANPAEVLYPLNSLNLDKVNT
ncbi:hypothetical protein BJV82DRAFT_584321 [Fennellomyces sp. T-0311]|nr:hypothetical protein BJV82DRAFT_584321 [Fennellomyces sp. T-0311]